MEYVIPLVLVLILVGGFVTFMVLNATKKSGPAGRDEETPGMGADDTPLGDTSEHAGTQTEHGTTAQEPEGVTRGVDDPDRAAHLARPGEGEGHTRLDFPGEHPQGESRRVGSDDDERADEEPTRDAVEAAPDEPDAQDTPAEGGRDAAAKDDEPAPPASERLADRGF